MFKSRLASRTRSIIDMISQYSLGRLVQALAMGLVVICEAFLVEARVMNTQLGVNGADDSCY